MHGKLSEIRGDVRFVWSLTWYFKITRRIYKKIRRMIDE